MIQVISQFLETGTADARNSLDDPTQCACRGGFLGKPSGSVWSGSHQTLASCLGKLLFCQMVLSSVPFYFHPLYVSLVLNTPMGDDLERKVAQVNEGWSKVGPQIFGSLAATGTGPEPTQELDLWFRRKLWCQPSTTERCGGNWTEEWTRNRQLGGGSPSSMVNRAPHATACGTLSTEGRGGHLCFFHKLGEMKTPFKDGKSSSSMGPGFVCFQQNHLIVKQIS